MLLLRAKSKRVEPKAKEAARVLLGLEVAAGGPTPGTEAGAEAWATSKTRKIVATSWSWPTY